MKATLRHLLCSTFILCFGTAMIAAQAETPVTPSAEKPAVAAPAVSDTTSTSTASVVAPAATPAPAPAAAPSAPAAPSASESTSAAPPAAAAAEPAAPASTAEPSAETAPLRRLDEAPASEAHHHGRANPRVGIFNNSYLGKDESADAVVAVFGNATSEGSVNDSVVAVFGNAHASGEVRNSVVAIFGQAYVDTKVREVVSIFGNVQLGPHAEVMGDVVPVFSSVTKDEKAVVHGNMAAVGGAPLGGLEWLHSYIQNCVLKVRPLAIAPHLGWAWAIAVGFLTFYFLLALLFREGTEKCVETLVSRPGASVLAAILVIVLTPVLIVLLCITVVGIAVVPFLGIALICASIFGKAVMLAWLGSRITRLSGREVHPALSVLVGGVIMLALYLIPVVGFLMYKLTGVLGTGVVVYSLLLSTKRNKPAPAVAVPAAGFTAPVAGVVPPMTDIPPAAAAAAAGAVVVEPVAAAVPPITSLARAGFWLRTAALIIDLILVAVLFAIFANMTHVHGGPGFLFVLATYGAVMWKLKGSTIGGIVCGLKVVRLDNRPIDWTTAIVRALGCFLSLVVVGLGFIWVAFDDEKQSWHDKIAGTTVVSGASRNSLV
jgi:uncharacterized RDD family membrane protein YckC